VNGRDGRPGHLREQALKSRERLGLEQIGLWQLHSIDPKVPRDEQFAVVKSLQDDGIIRHAGLSNVTVADIRSCLKDIQSGDRAESLQSRRSRQ
jgi:pyridoxine 4-dehydrogenase